MPKRSSRSCKTRLFIEPLEERRLLTNTVFVHPGVLDTVADFNRMVTKVTANAQPWLADWNVLTSQGYAQLGASPRPLVTVVRASTGSNYTQMYIDIERAYDTALRWKVSGDTRYADQTVTFLNAWAATNTSITGDSNASLAFGLYGFQWANIAEMMRSYSGWAAADQTQFQNYLLNVYIPGNQDLLVNHHGTDPTHYWANWDLCNIASEMAIGVFCDRHDLYENALNYLYTGIGNGALDKAIYYMHAGNLGQGQEEGRDQGHSGLDFAMLGEICQTARNQGDDVFSYKNNEILAGVEYFAKYNLGNDVPYVTYASSTGGVQTQVSSGARGNLRPMLELFYNHYVIMEGLSAPYTTQAVLQHTRPEGDYGNGDEYSWGTLVFALDPVATVQPPQSLVGYEKGTGNIQLNWWGGANDNTYNVYRATSASGPFTQIASGITAFTYTDSNPPTGTYYYKVTGVNGATETAATSVVSAVSTNALISQLKFDESSGTTASDSVGSLTGTLNGGASFAPGKSGNAISLDGSSGYVSLPGGAIAGLSDYTIATWVYLNSAQTWARIFDFGDSRGEWMMLTPKNGSGNLEFATSTTYNYNKQSIDVAPLATNQWVHVAVTFSNRLATLYVNGVAVGSNANMDFPPHEINGGMPNSWIGRSQYSVDPYLNGRVDDFRIYRGALPAGQVYTLATGNNAPAVPVAPAAFAATAIPGNQINLSWSAVGGATSYSLYRSTSASGPFWPIATVISGTTYADTDLAADLSSGTPYYYRVDAANAGGDGPTTSASAIALPPNASVPTSLVAKALSASAISLNWTASTNAATYTVRRSATSGGPYTVIASGLTNPTYTDTGRTVGTTYYYVVTAINASGETAFSNESNATPTDLFVHLKFDDGSGSIAADESGNGWNGTLANSPTWTSAGKVNGGLTLANVSVASNSTSAQTVSLPSGIVAGQTSFTIAAWVNLSTSATWMRLFDFGTGTNNYMFLSVNRGTSNQPRFAILAAGNATEEGINSNISVNTGVWTHLAVTYSNNLGTLYVNGFFAGSNAGMAWSPSTLGTTTQNYIGRSQWAADPVLNGTVDDFRIYAHALTATEVKALATAALPAAPSGLTATPVNGAGQVNLSWSATAGATKYHVYRSASSGGPYTEIAQSVSGTFYQDTNLSPDPNNGTTYYYVISAESAGGEGPQSAQASATLLPALPDSPTTLDVNVAKSGTLALSWDAAANAGSYIIARATSAAGPFTTIATVNGGATTSYTDAGLTNGRVYYYTVTSSNIAGVGEESPGDSAAPTDLYDYQKFDDATGTAAADASGHGYIGTLINGATWTTSSKIGPDALSLTGASSQYLSLPNGIVSGLTNFSVSAWVYLTTSTNWMRVFDFGTGTGNYMFLTVNRGTSFQPHFGILTTGNGTEQSINGNVSINTGIWTHLAVTWVNNLGTLYVNGAFAGSNSSMTWNPSTLGTTTQNYIGRSQFSADPYLNGRIDDFRIYSRALTLAEVSTIAANTLPSAPSGLSATVADGQATLTWNVASNAGTYNVKRSLSSGGPYSTITGGISGTSFIDTGLTDGTTYYYVVTGSNATGEGGNSAQLSVTPAPLSYAGTSDNDTYVIRLDPANLSMLQIFVDTPSTGSPTYEVRLSQIPSLSFDGTSGGGDQLAIDFANGNPVPGTGGVSFTGGDTLFIAGTTGADSFSIDGSHVSNNGVAPITYSNTARVEFDLLGGNDTLTQTAVPGAAVTFNGGAGNDTLNVNAGAFAFTGDAGATSANLSINVANAGSSVNFTGTQHLAALNLASGGAAAMTPAASPASAAIMNVASVIINGTGSSLNLSNNELLTATALATVQTQLDNSQLWTSVGGGALGSMIASGQTEVRYTLPGDTNLDGAVDVADLGALATNYGLTSGATWAQGDVNYDGAVNVGDLGMIATSYGATPAFTTTAPAAIAQPAAQAALITSGNVTGAASLNSPFAERPLYDEQADSTLDALLNPRKDHRELRAARHGVLER